MIGHGSPLILYRTDIDPLEGRFAFAHEIGHAVLWTKHPQIAKDWPVDRREIFADSFAQQLVIPSSLRNSLAREFCNINRPDELVKFTHKVGITVSALLMFAT